MNGLPEAWKKGRNVYWWSDQPPIQGTTSKNGFPTHDASGVGGLLPKELLGRGAYDPDFKHGPQGLRNSRSPQSSITDESYRFKLGQAQRLENPSL
jgi:hypothetical protein